MGYRTKVGIELYRGRLRLRLPREFCDGKQQAIYTSQPDSAEGWRKARQLALLIEMDFADGTFDPTLERYKSNNPLLPIDASKITLLDIWDKYCEYRRPQLSITHYEINYLGRYRNAIVELPNKLLANAVGIRDYLLQTRTPGTTKQLLVQFNAACKWAVKSSLIKVNPFDGMAMDIKNKRRQEEDIDPFTVAERDAIIAAFEEHPAHCRYANFVKFLFLTGCRTSEAVGLRWGDVSSDCRTIIFSSVITKGIRKGTKTNKARKFPCGTRLSSLLLAIRPESYSPTDLVFANK
ncbi:MAG: tyrosine-type recombinase/integrase, partial [Chroococcidiopsidaceae cyanobacterium CP_BM_ER_R8_30]|nr:tyrosine-type recombinase/integrase [Chroococcidiopsidaceae cyanobacterium CP_BM_ER_R8_30]